MQIDLLANSSDGESTYVVQFVFDEGKLSVFCDCAAGEYGKICKHKLSFLNDDKSLLAEGSLFEEFENIQKWIRQSTWPPLLLNLSKAEQQVKFSQAQLADAKKQIEKAMNQGI